VKRAAVLVALLTAGAMAQSYTLVANVLDGAGKRVTSAGYQCQFSLAQSVASGQLASADYRAVLGFWNHGFRVGIAEPGKAPGLERFDMRCMSPVRDQARISYALPAAAEVRLTALDYCGRQVATLVRQRQEPGRYRVSWNLAGVAEDRLPNGVYFLALAAGDEVARQKVVISR